MKSFSTDFFRRLLMTVHCLLLTYLLATNIPSVLAHAGLLTADPAPGQTVTAPRALTLTFTEPLTPGSTFTLTTGFFQTVPGITPVIHINTLHTTLTQPLASGQYTVQWQAVTADGGVTSGSYQFGVRQTVGGGIWMWGIFIAALAFVVGTAFYWRKANRVHLSIPPTAKSVYK